MTLIERATGCKPNLIKVLEFGAIVWVKVKNAGKLESQAVEGHFVGYDEQSKGYRIYFPWHRSIIVKCDVYFDKDTVVDVGNVVLEGETEGIELSNPTIPIKAPTSAPETSDMDTPHDTTETTPISAHVTPPSIPIKPHRNSLAGLPQYDPLQYGRGKSRSAAKKDKIALMVEGQGGFEASGVEFDDPAEAFFLFLLSSIYIVVYSKQSA